MTFFNQAHLRFTVVTATIGTVLCLFFAVYPAGSAPGNLDLSFDPGSNLSGSVFASAIDPNGRIIVGGMFSTVRGGIRRNIARLNADGTMDPGFDPGKGADNNVNAVGIQSDGKIIIGGDFTTINSVTRQHLARLNTDGSLDESFATVIDFKVQSLLILQNDQIFVGGQFYQVNGAFRQSIARLNADGTLDTAFDGGYISDIVFSMNQQPDGKLIIAGNLTINGTNTNRVARLNSDGSIDNSFNPGKGLGGFALAAALQPDLKIVIGGNITSANGITRSNIVRLNNDGSLDTNFIARADNNVYAVALQSDGKIIVGGYFSTINNTTRHRIARLYPDGSLDAGFNVDVSNFGVFDVVSILVHSSGDILIGGEFATVNGIPRKGVALLDSSGNVKVDFEPNGGINYSVNSIAVQPDRKVILGGYFSGVGSINRNNIARLTPDGSLDGTFDPGSGTDANIWVVSLQTDGKIVAGGNFTFAHGSTRNHIARFNSDGSLDSSFNQEPGPSDTVSAIAQQADGKLIIGGTFSRFGTTYRQYLARLNINGSLDSSFISGNGPNNFVNAIAIQPDGKVVFGGQFLSFNGTNRARIARLNGDGTLDTSFDPGVGANAIVSVAVIQPDAKVLIGGQFTSINGTNRNGFARLNSTGGLDTDFNPPIGPNSSISGVVIQPDGKIVIGGWILGLPGPSQRQVVRLNPDGGLDPTFDVGTGPNGGNVNSLALQPDNKVLVAGAFSTFGSRAQWCIARLMGDGPRLDLSRAGSNVVFSWSTNFVGFNLQFATQFNSANWVDTTDVPTIVGSQYMVTNQILGNQLYRLKGQ